MSIPDSPGMSRTRALGAVTSVPAKPRTSPCLPPTRFPSMSCRPKAFEVLATSSDHTVFPHRLPMYCTASLTGSARVPFPTRR